MMPMGVSSILSMGPHLPTGEAKTEVGARGFEPPTSRTRTVRAIRTALRPAQFHYILPVPALQESTDGL